MQALDAEPAPTPAADEDVDEDGVPTRQLPASTGPARSVLDAPAAVLVDNFCVDAEDKSSANAYTPHAFTHAALAPLNEQRRHLPRAAEPQSRSSGDACATPPACTEEAVAEAAAQQEPEQLVYRSSEPPAWMRGAPCDSLPGEVLESSTADGAAMGAPDSAAAVIACEACCAAGLAAGTARCVEGAGERDAVDDVLPFALDTGFDPGVQ